MSLTLGKVITIQSPEFTCQSANLDSAIFREKTVPTTAPFPGLPFLNANYLSLQAKFGSPT